MNIKQINFFGDFEDCVISVSFSILLMETNSVKIVTLCWHHLLDWNRKHLFQDYIINILCELRLETVQLSILLSK